MNISKAVFKAICLTALTTPSAYAQTYKVPPSSSTSARVPYISDAAMEQCVVLYNRALWLANDIDRTKVDEYSQASVDAYNAKVSTHKNMTNAFNRDCAGKQSESAYKAAQELNRRKRGG